ncbi:hypothetical protein [Henriciella pelagia]|uniref:hypothetical protein n=1 Tax=Henriciella pelagia TaxID=1977912 RepID=UPI00351347EF
MGFSSDKFLTASEVDRRQKMTDRLNAAADEKLSEQAYAFAFELHALIEKHGLQHASPLILEGASEAIVGDFNDHLNCYAAFEDAEAAFGGDDEDREAA